MSRARRRRQVERHPPEFKAETEHARAWLEVHAGLWSPQLRDVKRLDGGRTALLFRDRCGTALAAVLDRGGQVRDVVTRDEFRALAEVLR